MTQAARQDELQLVQACAAGDRAALARFESHYLVLVDLVAHRMGAPPSLAAEAKQILRCRLLVRDGGPPGISTFRGTGPLAGWLAIAASRLIWKLPKLLSRAYARPSRHWPMSRPILPSMPAQLFCAKV